MMLAGCTFTCFELEGECYRVYVSAEISRSQFVGLVLFCGMAHRGQENYLRGFVAEVVRN